MDMNDDELKKFVENGGSSGGNNIEVRCWEARYKENYNTKCFRLTIGKSDYDRVYKEDFWPNDIYVRKYWLSNEEKQALNIK